VHVLGNTENANSVASTPLNSVSALHRWLFEPAPEEAWSVLSARSSHENRVQEAARFWNADTSVLSNIDRAFETGDAARSVDRISMQVQGSLREQDCGRNDPEIALSMGRDAPNEQALDLKRE